MAGLFLLLGIALFAVAIFAFIKASQAKKAAPNFAQFAGGDPFDHITGAADFKPTVLGPGAIITYGATDYVVRGTLTLKQGPYVWYEHMLDGGDGSSWLSVEIDEGQLELIWWTTRKGAGIAPNSIVEFQGITYREQERGHANYTSAGTTGLPETGVMRYIDLADDTEQNRLGFEGWANDESWEVSTGRRVLPGEFTVYPAPTS